MARSRAPAGCGTWPGFCVRSACCPSYPDPLWAHAPLCHCPVLPMSPKKSIRTFDPARIARLETENWEAYYQKRWGRLLQVSVNMVKEAFGLNTWQALQAAYLVGRAEIVAAPFPNNDVPRAEAYMRRFYSLVKRVHHECFDVAQA